jgi:1-acyl-sn-glycerol-3-phosphate acyltransferase
MNNFFKLPIVGQIIERVDRDTEIFGIQQAMRNLVKTTSTRLEIKGFDNNLEKILEEKAGVIVANHPYEAETLALLASLPCRKDLFLIISYVFLHLCPQIDRYLIPVFVRHHRKNIRHVPILGKMIESLNHIQKFSPEEEHRKNIESLKKASLMIQKGGMMIIFPNRRSPDGRWFHGVGHMIKGVGLTKDAYVIKAYIEGTSDWDYLRLIPYIGKYLPVIKVTFSKPVVFRDIYNEEAKKITYRLEEDYNRWVKTL